MAENTGESQKSKQFVGKMSKKATYFVFVLQHAHNFSDAHFISSTQYAEQAIEYGKGWGLV